jgi:hypothetical protein
MQTYLSGILPNSHHISEVPPHLPVHSLLSPGDQSGLSANAGCCFSHIREYFLKSFFMIEKD